MHDIRTLIGKINFIGGQKAQMKKVREMSIKTAAMFRQAPKKARDTISEISRIEEFHNAEAASWLEPEDIDAGKTGAFDACDLRHWLLIARSADVPYVPATQILSLSEDELGAISGPVKLPTFVKNAITKGMKTVFTHSELDQSDVGHEIIDTKDIGQRLYDAMDDVPFDSIVRSNISGPSTLKAFAGSGILDSGDNSMKLGSDLEVGPGWVRTGNRRRIDATDSRFIDTFAGGHKDHIHYLARPWVNAARRNEGDDPHRHGSPFAGKGSWPVEWRVFVENGKVTGVASYYGWCGQATPLDAARAIEASELAQKMVDWAVAAKLSCRWMDMEILRQTASKERLEEPEVAGILARFPRDAINCTLDFIESEDQGMVFLEGGPAHTPMGGGHPCAFAGHNLGPVQIADCTGVALRLLDNVCLGDLGSWKNAGPADGNILSWDEARALAQTQTT